jgi:hypothetical protein
LVAAAALGMSLKQLLTLIGLTSASSTVGSIGGAAGGKAVGLGAAGPIGYAGGFGYGLGIRSGFELGFPQLKSGNVTAKQLLESVNDVGGGVSEIGNNFAANLANDVNTTSTSQSFNSIVGPIGTQGDLRFDQTAATKARNEAYEQQRLSGIERGQERLNAHIAGLDADPIKAKIELARNEVKQLNLAMKVIKSDPTYVYYANGARGLKKSHATYTANIRKAIAIQTKKIAKLKSQL